MKDLSNPAPDGNGPFWEPDDRDSEWQRDLEEWRQAMERMAEEQEVA